MEEAQANTVNEPLNLDALVITDADGANPIAPRKKSKAEKNREKRDLKKKALLDSFNEVEPKKNSVSTGFALKQKPSIAPTSYARHISAPNKGHVYWGDADVFMKAGPVVVWAPKVGIDNLEEENVKFERAVVDLFFPSRKEKGAYFVAINFVTSALFVLTARIDTKEFLEVVVPKIHQEHFHHVFEHKIDATTNPRSDENRWKSKINHDVFPLTACCCDVCKEVRPRSQFKIFLLENQCRPVIGTHELNDVVSRSDLRAGEFRERVEALISVLEYAQVALQGCSITYNSVRTARSKVFVVKAVVPVQTFFEVYYKALSTTLPEAEAKKETKERASMTAKDNMWKKHQAFFNKETSHTAAMLIYTYIQTH